MGIETLINAIGLFGVAVFAISGAFAAARKDMDPIGFLLLGTVTAIGGGTVRDIILDRAVFWLAEPSQLILAIVVSMATYLFVAEAAHLQRKKWMAWSDALGLAAFAVQGALITININPHPLIVVIMGTMTAVGGGVIRDVLSNERPMIFRGQLYAIPAMAGALTVTCMHALAVPNSITAAAGFLIVLIIRGATLIFDIRSGPPGQMFTIGELNKIEPK